MNIVIDVREIKLIEKINELTPQFQPITITTSQLPLGDIIIQNKNVELIIIERKTINDLISSITVDKRYDEQSYRLNECEIHNHNIFYLIEGTIPKGNTMVFSALFSLNYYKGFSVIRTMNIDETAFMICNMAHKMHRELIAGKKVPFYGKILNDASVTQPPTVVGGEASTVEQPVVDAPAYSSVLKKAKSANILRENINEIMLCQIPSISSASAHAILKIYPSIAEIVHNLTQDEHCLDNIKLEDSNGKMRKISSAVVSNVVKYLLPQKVETKI